MSRRPLTEKNIRKLTRLGNSISVTLPIDFIRELRWREKQKIIVEKKGNTLILKDWRNNHE